MGLRSDLEDLLAIQQLTGQFRDATGSLREQAAKQLLNQQLPELAAQGQFGQIAGLAGDAGVQQLQTDITGKLLAGQQATAKVKSPLVKEQLRNIYTNATEEALDVAASLPTFEDQVKALGVGERGFQAGANRSAAAGRFAKGQEQAQSFKASDVIDKEIKPFDEETRKLEKAQNFLKNPNDLASFNAAKALLVRYIQGGGTLTEEDMKLLTGESFEGDTTKFLNYWNNKHNFAKANEAQKKSLQGLVETSLSTVNAQRNEALMDALNRVISFSPELYDEKTNKLKPALAVPIARAGLEFKGFDENGGIQLVPRASKKSTTISQPPAAGTGASATAVDTSKLVQLANSLPPEADKLKSNVTATIEAWSGQEGGMPKEIYDQLVERINNRRKKLGK